GQCRAALPEPAQHGEAVDVGQPDVEHEELEVPAQRQDQRLLAGRHRGGGVPGGTQPLGDERGDPRLVLGDENLRHYLAPSWSVSSVVTSSGSTTTSSSASVLGRNPGAGSSSVKREPRPTCELTVTRPPCAAAMAATIDRPRPEPDRGRPCGPVTWAKRSKTRSTWSGGMPMPSSSTHSATSPSRRAAPSRTVLPSSENFTALAASWRSACVTRSWSSGTTASTRSVSRQ